MKEVREKIGWKIVQEKKVHLARMGGLVVVNGKIKVSMVSSRELVYNFNVWTKRNVGDGPLCLFKTRKLARQFFHSRDLFWRKSYNLKIYKCIYNPSIEHNVYYYEDGRINESLVPLNDLPEGTVLANQIMLLNTRG